MDQQQNGQQNVTNEQNVPSVQNLPSEPNAPKKSNAAIIIIVVVGIIVLAGLVFGGWYLWKAWSKKSTSTATTSPTATSATPTVTVTTSASATASATSSAAKTSDYIIADSNTRVISESELKNLTPWQLKVARNEIYARYGRPFVHKDLQCYFAKKSWYSINNSFSESILSTTENKNIATIQAYEQKTGSPLASKDSGCNTNQ